MRRIADEFAGWAQQFDGLGFPLGQKPERKPRNRYATQGRLLIDKLKRRPHTYMQMLAYGLSCSPWKRVAECLRDDEELVKGVSAKGLTTWTVRKTAA